MIANAIRWLIVQPEPAYDYPDHYDEDAFFHALRTLARPTPWRWYVRAGIRSYQRIRKVVA